MYPVKKCRPDGVWPWGRATVKFYLLAPPDDDVDAGTVAAARATLADSSASPRNSEVDDEVGFAILHRYYTPGGTEHLLLACTWLQNDELWETLWTYADGAFELENRTGSHQPTYCVWEMGVVTHETRAWRRVLDEGITPVSIQAYLRDMLNDVV